MSCNGECSITRGQDELISKLEKENLQLTEQLEKVQSAWIVATVNLGGAEDEVKKLTEEHEKDSIIIGELQSNEARLFNELKETTEALDDSVPQVAFDRLKDRLSKAQDNPIIMDLFVALEDMKARHVRGGSFVFYIDDIKELREALGGESTPKGEVKSKTVLSGKAMIDGYKKTKEDKPQ